MSYENRARRLVAAALLPVLLLLFSSCGATRDEDERVLSQTPRRFRVGVGPTWKEFRNPTEANLLDMFQKLSTAGEMALAQSNWRDGEPLSGTVPEIITLLHSQRSNFGYGDLSYGINFFDQATGVPDLAVSGDSTNDWSNARARELYQQVASTICRDYGARYLALGLEVDTYAYHPPAHREDYDRFVTAYKGMYDELKALCPATKIFVTFQLEHLKGIGERTWQYDVEPHWGFLNEYEGKLDLLAFTTYPEFEYDQPSQIPADYYASILADVPSRYRNTPIAFVETGWSSRNGEGRQVEYLRRFEELVQGLNLAYVNWVFMHDIDETPPNPRLSLGLRTYRGEARGVWDAWTALRSRPFQP